MRLLFAFLLLLPMGLLARGPAGSPRPKIIIVAEHHHRQDFRSAFENILQQTPGIDCVFLEFTPEVDAVAHEYLRGTKTLQDYVRRHRVFVSESVWNKNFAGRESVLRTARAKGLKVFHVDYSNQQRSNFLGLSDDASLIWNYKTRHEIMTRNISRQKNSCRNSLYLVGDSHLETDRILRLMSASQTNGCYDYKGPPLRSLAIHLEEAGYDATSATIILDPNQQEKLTSLDPGRLGREDLSRLQQLEFRNSASKYVEKSVESDLKTYDRIYKFRP